MSDVYSSASANKASIFNSWMMSNAHVTSEGDGSLSAHLDYGVPYSTHSVPYDNSSHEADYLDLNDPAPDANGDVPDIQLDTQCEDTSTLQGIMTTYPKWRLVLAYLRLLIRLAICKGETENPHLITKAKTEKKATFICHLFAQSLLRANTSTEELEQGQKLICVIHVLIHFQ